MLVAYASKYGATAEVADAELEVDVKRAYRVRSLDRYRDLVLGVAPYVPDVDAGRRCACYAAGSYLSARCRCSPAIAGEEKGDPHQRERH